MREPRHQAQLWPVGEVGSLGSKRETTAGACVHDMNRLSSTLDSLRALERKPGRAWRRRQRTTLTGHKSCCILQRRT